MVFGGRGGVVATGGLVLERERGGMAVEAAYTWKSRGRGFGRVESVERGRTHRVHLLELVQASDIRYSAVNRLHRVVAEDELCRRVRTQRTVRFLVWMFGPLRFEQRRSWLLRQCWHSGERQLHGRFQA